MWGVPLLGGDDRADVILLKFLRARDFKVGDSLRMLEKCLEWREEFKTEKLTEEDLGFKDLEGRVAYMRGYDKEGHPVCYNAYGVFKEREMYERVFGDEEKINKFLRWRVQVLERGVKLLHFKPGGVNSIIQVTDLKDMPKRELRVASNQILSLFQDNYPEMVATKVNVSFWRQELESRDYYVSVLVLSEKTLVNVMFFMCFCSVLRVGLLANLSCKRILKCLKCLVHVCLMRNLNLIQEIVLILTLILESCLCSNFQNGFRRNSKEWF